VVDGSTRVTCPAPPSTATRSASSCSPAPGGSSGPRWATLVNFYNPSLIIIGGGVAASGDLLLAAIREAVYRRSLPLATRNLRIMQSPLSDRAGLTGAAAMVVDELLSEDLLGRWIHHGSPVGRPELAGAGRP
jgi:hypothetical protein